MTATDETTSPDMVGSRVLVTNMLFSAFVRLWRAGLQLIFTPIFIHLLGPEAYGLVAFNATVLMALLFIEQATSPVILREFGRWGGATSGIASIRDLLRSLEVVSCATALTIGGSVLILAPWIADKVLSTQVLDKGMLTDALRLIGLNIALQWPSFLYSSCFVALQKQNILARLTAVLTTVQVVGAALLLWLMDADILSFLAWQVFGAAVNSLVLGMTAWKLIPLATVRPRVRMAVLRRVFRFAMGTMAIGGTGAALTQADKLIVSGVVTLDQFSVYAVAFFVANQVAALAIAPISTPLQPYLAHLVAMEREDLLAREYHRWTQILWLACLVVLGPLIAFPGILLGAWLGTASPMVGSVATLLPVVLIGTMLNSVMGMPFILQMASGWVRLSLFKNIVAMAVFLPALVLLLPHYGMVVGAWLWVALNLYYFLIEVPLMHRRLLRAELWRWWGYDILLPGGITAGLMVVSARLAPVGVSPVWGVAYVTLTAVVIGCALLLVLPMARHDVVLFLRFVRYKV